MTRRDAIATAEEFEELAEERATQLLHLLREPSLIERVRFWESCPRDPELRKLLGRIHTAIRDAQRLAAEHPAEFDEAARARAVALLRRDPGRLSLDAALEIIDGWDQLLIERGDERYVRDLLATELARDKIDTTATTWIDVFGSRPPKALGEALANGGGLDVAHLSAAKNQLAELYRTRSVLYDLSRARLAMKGHYLSVLAPVLLVLIAAFAVMIELAGGDLKSILLAAFAGAVGATLSGTFKLRDQIKTINALREFRPAVVVQPLVGAAAGLFLLLVLDSGAIKLDWGGSDWATDGAVAFVAGFAEPFFLGVVKRVAEIGGSPAPQTREPDRPVAHLG
jgi:hypothetical protein